MSENKESSEEVRFTVFKDTCGAYQVTKDTDPNQVLLYLADTEELMALYLEIERWLD